MSSEVRSRLKDEGVLIQAGEFSSYGGWVLDTQFILNMGASFLLAHGLGKPVSPAKTTVTFPKPGCYTVWAYTRDWVADWKENMAPGLFKIKVGDVECESIFGNEGKEWHWQRGANVTVCQGDTTIELIDLKGFEGRCAALLFTPNSMTEDFANELKNDSANNSEALQKLIFDMNAPKVETSAKLYDLIVVGGGIAGMCSALKAAREGLVTALVQDRFVVGGNNSSEVRVWLGGSTCHDPFPKVGECVNAFEQERVGHYGDENTGEIYEDEKKMALLMSEPNLDLYMGYTLTGVKTSPFAFDDDGKPIVRHDVNVYDRKIDSIEISSVKNLSKIIVSASQYADCTGDATMGYMAGADYEMTTSGHMGVTNIWHIKNHGEGNNISFPRCPWAIDLTNVPFPGRNKISSGEMYVQGERALGGWFWESGYEHDPIEKAEYIRDINFRAMYGAVDCLKNVDHEYPTYDLEFAAYIGGKRESRRMLGDILLSRSEAIESLEFDDRFVPSTWDFDVHHPDHRFYTAFHEGDSFIALDHHDPFPRPYFVPYRCFYSRNVSNLYMAGRNVSVTHEALGTVRVMRTGGMMGEVVAAASAVCKKNGATPREVYSKYLNELKELLD